MIKVKEKLDKCNKEKLSEFCDVLDIPIAKATTRKEDIVANLIYFLVAPHATNTVLLAEKEKSCKSSKKRKRVVRGSSSSRSAASKRSAKEVEQQIPLLLVERQALNEAREGEKNRKHGVQEAAWRKA
ncbi:uncharacterized protein LOC121263420 isoform X2 [Juglans microcarpa x Juglans regia]|uniref:uncharacterized protein LOC121263420 isoform X2 n=1 Tax=Juglans microcarpa x Juglans regia TaxID=2249226 RepID=UPI001B7E7654|nr:uncharacterized protein LOC121263420 isoform X2 [Juglans microcarpa x Juglans regia]